MQQIIIHKDSQISSNKDDGLLRFALSSAPAADVVLEGLAKWSWPLSKGGETLITLPKDIDCANTAKLKNIITYQDNIPVRGKILEKSGLKNWSSIFNGRFVITIAEGLIGNILKQTNADLVAVEVSSQFKAYNEKALITRPGRCIGFRRYYSDSLESVPVPSDWPHCIFIKNNILEQVVNGSGLPLQFSEFLAKCKQDESKAVSVKIGGFLLDLNTEDGMLNFCNIILGSKKSHNGTPIIHNEGINANDRPADTESPRILGNVLLGSSVRIGSKAVIVGPSIIGDNTKIEDEAVITSSIIGPNLLVPARQLIQNSVVKVNKFNDSNSANRNNICGYRENKLPRKSIFSLERQSANFLVWPKFSYAGIFKRVADIIAASIALLLFLPLFPIIAIAIKLSSPGKVFYKDKRQGLRGKEFNCIKFRTMITGADNIQEKLRAYNKVDGPQFKMDDDPRVNSVGRFLRATYIDEVPQFINVLLGQMSVVGPRPSPESENELCPFWRYARLSVRPGITGLWQVFGTRESRKDFQEWIYYDIKYIKELSLKTDLWICCKTAIKIVKLFVNHL
jgi:lipopolysaccharide/colanic/teichoic acid biosynthesis glycosyltransferase